MPRERATIFGSVFQSYYIFVSVFFNSPMPFFGSILPIFAFSFCCILCVFHQNVKQCFGHKIFVWFLYSWTYFLINASIFLGSIFDTGYFIFCSTVLSLSGTLPPLFMASYPRSRGPCMTRHPKWSYESPFKHINLIGDTNKS